MVMSPAATTTKTHTDKPASYRVMVSLKLIYKGKYKENINCVLHIAIFFRLFSAYWQKTGVQRLKRIWP